MQPARIMDKYRNIYTDTKIPAYKSDTVCYSSVTSLAKQGIDQSLMFSAYAVIQPIGVTFFRSNLHVLSDVELSYFSWPEHLVILSKIDSL